MKQFLLIQRECLRRAVTPFIMDFFMSTILLACQALEDATIKWIIYFAVLAACIYFNVALMVAVGENAIKSLASGEVRRQTGLSDKEGKDYKPYQEYRPYKGFLTGFYIALPVAILILLAAAGVGVNGTEVTQLGTSSIAEVILDMLAGWAIIPFQILRNTYGTSLYWALFLCLIPILSSAGGYFLGAAKERKKRENMEQYRAQALSAGKRKKK